MSSWSKHTPIQFDHDEIDHVCYEHADCQQVCSEYVNCEQECREFHDWVCCNLDGIEHACY